MERTEKPAVFVFTTAYYPLIGGAEVAVQETAERLSRDFRFFIFTSRMQRDLPGRDMRPEGTIIRLGLGVPVDKFLLPVLAAWAAWREIRQSPAGQGTLFWGMDISAGAIAPALLSIFFQKIPFVLTVQYGYGETRLARARLGLIGLGFRFMLARAQAVTAISKYLLGVAKRFGWRGEGELIPNGADIDAFRLLRRETDRGSAVLITTSRLVPKNGIDILIQAMAEVARELPSARCHILGDGPERARLEELARSLGLEDRVIFFGNVAHESIPRYLAAADLFVRASRSEGMGNSFVEAMAAGLPVIGTPVGGIPDIIQNGKTGLFSRLDDPQDLAQKILLLLSRRELARTLAENGKRFVESHFSWDLIACSYHDLFTKLLAEQKPKVLIATPTLPPAVSGPAGYAVLLGRGLFEKGCQVRLISYGQDNSSVSALGHPRIISSRLPLGVKHFLYFYRAWKALAESDSTIALDPVAVGLPLALAAALRRKPFFVRVEGDSLWERYVQRTGRELTLREFYERFSEARLSAKEQAWHWLSRWVYRRARAVVFSSEWRASIFKLGYPLSQHQQVLIAPPWPKVESVSQERDQTFIFAGRFVRVKNITRLVRAFLAVSGKGWRLELIGEGPERIRLEELIQERGAGDRISIVPPMSRDDLARRMALARALVLPSLSEVSPNVILDCLRVGTPFLLTRETGFYEALKDVGLFVNPLDEHDIAARIRELLDPKTYAQALERFRQVHPVTRPVRNSVSNGPRKPRAAARGMAVNREASLGMPPPEGGGNGVRSWGAIAEEWLALIRDAPLE